VLVTQTLGEVPSQLAITAERDARLADQAARMSGADSVRLLDLLAAAMRLSKDGADAQTQLEVALVKAAAPEVDPSTRALLARMERMEAALRGGAPVAAAPAAPAPVAAVPAPPSAAQPSAATAQPAAPAPAAPSMSPPPAAAPSPPAPVGPSGAELSRPTGPPLAEASPPAPVGPDAASPSRSTGPPEPAPVAEVAAREPIHEPAAAVAVAEPPAPIGELDLAMVQELWPAVLQNLAESNQLLAGCLAEARPMAVSGREITLAFTPNCGFQKKKAEGAAERQLLTAAFQELTGVAPRLLLETRDAEELGAEPEVLGEDDFIARLRAEFDAVDHQPDQQDQEQA
jgi:DNA polymerase-3 subunit gamma/tau